MATTLERIVAIARRQPEGITAPELERALLAEPNCPQVANLGGFCVSVLKAGRLVSGEPVFKAVGDGVYTVNEQFPSVTPNKNEWTLEMFAEEAFEKWWAEQGIVGGTGIMTQAFKELAFKAFMAGYKTGDNNARPTAE